MSPQVSVVIPSYNRSALAAQAIESVLAQTYDDFEIVFVDDGSHDDTRQVIASHKDTRIRYVFQENAGLGAARNAGIALACGDYVAFLDSDDLFLPKALEHQVRTLQHNPDAGFAAGGYVFIDEIGQALAARRPWQHRPQLDLMSALQALPIVPSGVVVRKEWLDKTGGFAVRRRSEDYDLWIRLMEAGCRMAWTEHIVCGYRIHSNQLVRDGRSVKISDLAVLDQFFAQSVLQPSLREKQDAAVAAIYLSGAFREYAAGQLQDAQDSLARAIELAPAFMEGPVPQVANALIGWATDPVTGDPADYVLRVLAYLPPAAARLKDMDQRLVYAAVSRSAVDALQVGNAALARTYLERLDTVGYPPGDNPDLFVELMAEAVRGCETAAQESILERFFCCLPAGTAGIAVWRRKALGRIYMARSFACVNCGARNQARHWAWRGVRQDPIWLKNPGVLSILGKPSIIRAGSR